MTVRLLGFRVYFAHNGTDRQAADSVIRGKMMKWRVVALAALLIAGCGKQQEETYQPTFSTRGVDAPKEYIVGIHPLHNPKRLVEVYGPIVDYLNASIPQAHFRLEASRNYEEFEKKLYGRHFDFAMPNPYQTVRSLKYRIPRVRQDGQ